MRRFYADSISADIAVVSDREQLHHLADVLRLKVGADIVILDGQGGEYQGEITALDKKRALVRLDSKKHERGGEIKLTIACAIPKGSRMDDLVDHLTQLGVARMIPMLTERVVARPVGPAAAEKVERWKKIARNAVRQCQGCHVPAIDPVTPLKNVIAGARDCPLKLIPTLEGERKHIREVISAGQPSAVIVLIGPEGDFTPAEVALALREGFVPVTLGYSVLRVATAAVAVASFFRLAVGNTDFTPAKI